MKTGLWHVSGAALVALLLTPESAMADARCAAVATGGTVSLVQKSGQSYCVHQYSTVGTSTFHLLRPRTVEHLIVGGGGGGGAFAGGGGGGGGVRTDTIARPTGSFPVTVGGGGAGNFRSAWPVLPASGENGANSSVFGTVALGGGGGGTFNGVAFDGGGPGQSGGSGGGASHASAPGGAGTAGQGNAGSTGTVSSGNSSGGGGGGAEEAGTAGTDFVAGRGGNGRLSGITGSDIYYGGGGAGGGDTRLSLVLPNIGGLGGGGASRNNQVVGESGVNGLGGGGAGGRVDASNTAPSGGGAGGSGVVILRYIANTGPTANAGSDAVAVSGLEFVLDGTATFDPEDNIDSYAWVQISGTPVVLNDAISATPSFTAPQPANGIQEFLSFQLTVTDVFGVTSSDTVMITLQGVTDLTASKTVTVLSEDGSDCGDLDASSPTGPENPAAIPGACIQYMITVENTGAVAASGLSLVDELPANLILRAAELGSGWGSAATLVFVQDCMGPGCTVEVTGGVIEAATSAEITIRATIN